jgi:NADPH-dependent 7-cyano-7-deazaguanine reductase QueF
VSTILLTRLPSQCEIIAVGLQGHSQRLSLDKYLHAYQHRLERHRHKQMINCIHDHCVRIVDERVLSVNVDETSRVYQADKRSPCDISGKCHSRQIGM